MAIHKVAVGYVKKFFPNVRNVVDAKESIDVTVRGSDVQDSKPKDPKECAMARACRREYDVDAALVSTSVAYLIRGDLAIRYVVPGAVKNEIIAFDRFKVFAPGEYWLRRPSHGHNLGYERAPHNGKSKKRGPRAPQHVITGIRPSIKTGPRQ